MTAPDFLACDWGTTHLRAWVIDENGEVLRRAKLPLGVSKLAPGEAARIFRREIRAELEAEALPAVLCGMVGSTLGWTVVPYRVCPAALADVAAGMVCVETKPPTWIVPGLQCERFDGAPDVMRGEETQVFGLVASDADYVRGRHIICHPGTHTKWVLLDRGTIKAFATVMTGELFELLHTHSVLKSETRRDDEASFDRGVAAAGDGNALASRLFTVRSRAVTGEVLASSKSYLSGLLIGAEVAGMTAALTIPSGAGVTLLGDEQLCRWYQRVLSSFGFRTTTADGEPATICGLRALKGMLDR